MSVVKVKSYNRGGTKVKAHVRGTGNRPGYVGDCSAKEMVKKTIKIAKMSNAKNPVKTGNIVVDFVVGRIPGVKYWNAGFNAGKAAFMVQQTYKETCKRKK